MRTQHRFFSGRRRLLGMTLVEVMIASAIALIVTGGAMWLVVEGMATSMKTSNVSGNDLTHWGLANRLVFDTRTATTLTVYSDFSTATIAAEGKDGVTVSGTSEPVGNFLVLALRLPEKDTGVWGCSKLTGYVYDPAKKTLSKFEYEIDPTSKDYTDGLTVPELLTKHFSTLKAKLQTAASDLELPALAAGGTTKGAFYWPISTSGQATSKAILRVRLGDTDKHWRVRDSRLIEVAFYIRS